MGARKHLQNKAVGLVTRQTSNHSRSKESPCLGRKTARFKNMLPRSKRRDHQPRQSNGRLEPRRIVRGDKAIKGTETGGKRINLDSQAEESIEKEDIAKSSFASKKTRGRLL